MTAASTDWLPVQVSPSVRGPSVVLEIDVALAFLSASGADVGSVIQSAQVAAANVVSAAGTSSTVLASTIAEAFAAVDGIAAVRSALIGGVSAFVGSGGSSYCVLPSGVQIADVRIV